MIGSLHINSTDCPTLLCILGIEENTDKSPFNKSGHRHPYTPVYSMLFSPLKNKPIRFTEIGVSSGASAALWCRYFSHPETSITVFDCDVNFLENVKQRVYDSRLNAKFMNVCIEGSIRENLGEELYDVILDDSSHHIKDQIRIIKEAFPKLKSGGMLIIEDIFKHQDEKEYERNIQEELNQCSFSYFVVCEHNLRWSPGWDNDKLLVLVKA